MRDILNGSSTAFWCRTTLSRNALREELGADGRSRIEAAGALKAAARPLPTDEAELTKHSSQLLLKSPGLAAPPRPKAQSEHAPMIAAHKAVLSAASPTGTDDPRPALHERR